MIHLLEFHQLNRPVTADQIVERECALAIMAGVLKSARPAVSEAEALEIYRALIVREAL